LTLWLGLAWLGLAWLGLAWLGLAWLGFGFGFGFGNKSQFPRRPTDSIFRVSTEIFRLPKLIN
jgi:hypothetical protein